MSFNRENVTWESKDGTWNLGFFATTWEGSESDGFDPEWDVEYDFESFSTVITGRRSPDDALNAWNGANPGGSTVCEREGNEKDCDRYDEMARECKERVRKEEAEYRRMFGRRRY